MWCKHCEKPVEWIMLATHTECYCPIVGSGNTPKCMLCGLESHVRGDCAKLKSRENKALKSANDKLQAEMKVMQSTIVDLLVDKRQKMEEIDDLNRRHSAEKKENNARTELLERKYKKAKHRNDEKESREIAKLQTEKLQLQMQLMQFALQKFN